jgi:hypothetical protein
LTAQRQQSQRPNYHNNWRKSGKHAQVEGSKAIGEFIVLKRILFSAACSLLFMLGGCASSHVMLGQARPAISPDQVKLYVRPPAKYQEIAVLESSSKNSFAVTQQGKTNKAIERLKEEAAKLGANGVLLQGTGDQYGGTVNTGSATATTTGGTYSGVGVPVMHKAASGVAIFVENE